MGRILIFMFSVLLFMTQFVDYGVATAEELKFDEQTKQVNDFEKVFFSAGEFRHFKPPICQYLVDVECISIEMKDIPSQSNIFYDGIYAQLDQRKFILKLPLENNIGDFNDDCQCGIEYGYESNDHNHGVKMNC